MYIDCVIKRVIEKCNHLNHVNAIRPNGHTLTAIIFEFLAL